MYFDAKNLLILSFVIPGLVLPVNVHVLVSTLSASIKPKPSQCILSLCRLRFWLIVSSSTFNDVQIYWLHLLLTDVGQTSLGQWNNQVLCLGHSSARHFAKNHIASIQYDLESTRSLVSRQILGKDKIRRDHDWNGIFHEKVVVPSRYSLETNQSEGAFSHDH